VGGKWDVSNKQRIGFSEVELVQKMINGVSRVIRIEEMLAGGATAADIESKVLNKAGKNADWDSGGRPAGDKKDSEDFEYLTYSQRPAFTDKHKSLMSKLLTPELFASLKDKTTSGGYTLSNAIQTGVETPHLGVGITAGDEESYEVFQDIMYPIIAGWHGGYDAATQKHPTDLDPSHLAISAQQLEKLNKYVVSTRIRAARNIRGYALPPGATQDSAAAVEGILKKTFDGLEGDLKGTYYPLGGMTPEQESDLQSQGFLFQKPKTTNLLTNAGAARYWPDSRGIFHNDNKTALCWCNEEDHCRIISMSKDGDVKSVFTRFAALSDAMKASAEASGAALMHSENLGFIGSCPSNLGTGLRASVMIVLPELNKNIELLEKVCAKYDLQPRGSAGEHSAAVGGKWDVSNKQRIGFSEVELVQKMINGVSKVIEIEEMLAAGKPISDVEKYLSRKKVRGSLSKKATGFSPFGNWKQRFFEYDPDTHILAYYKADQLAEGHGKTPMGSINTQDCTIERDADSDNTFKFTIVAAAKHGQDTTRDRLPMLASSIEEMEDWIVSIQGEAPFQTQAATDAMSPVHASGPAITPGLRAKFADAGQEQVFDFVDKNTDAQNRELAAQLESLDLERIARLHTSAMDYDTKAQAGGDQGTIEPLDSFASVESATREQKDNWTKAGMDALAAGEVALLVLSGGQGTRLGFSGPKGKYDIGLPSGKTLFQLFGERLKKLTDLAATHGKKDSVTIPWAVMTSPMNHEETSTYFEEQSFFGLQKENVHFFAQGTLPCMTLDGKLMLETGHSVGAASDGNGGIYGALKTSGVLDNFKKKGIKYVHVFSVDNAICRVADPMFMGYCISEGADCGNKVVWKAAPEEKVGVVAKRNGKPHVVEYSEITKAMSEQKDAKGKLVFGAGNICNHFYTTEFLDAVTDDALIYHVARKQIPVPNEKGEAVKPAEKNGIKLECFIFDAFPMSKKMAVLEGARADEFSPVKNAPGQGLPDSPDTARMMISEQHIRWAEAAGAKVIRDGDKPFEISPGQSYAGEGLSDILNGQTIDMTGDSMQATGASA
jgi:UDP-N-acetylglucosamine pyrophosphorylase/protein-arginine kinase